MIYLRKPEFHILRVAAAALLVFSIGAHAESKYEESPLDPIYDLVEAGKYPEAVDKLEAILNDDADDADALSLMGYTYRKQKQFDQALSYYQRALAIDPQHKATNEYLGQLYLETNQLAKAQERLAVLDEACFFPCKEYTSLKYAIENYQQ